MKSDVLRSKLQTLPSNLQKSGAVLVVGGGIAGVQASLDLADSGFKVYLVESSSAIGGVMAQLDKTFPTNDCALCILSPKLVECGRHLNIEIITNAKIENVEGEAGDFKASILQKPRYIDPDKCIGCGICAEKCPTRVIDAYNEDLNERKAIYIKYPQAVPMVYTIDEENCLYLTRGRCRLCERMCEREAVDFEQKEKDITLEVGSIILAPGFDEFDAHLKCEYGYGRYSNVVTSIQFERILSASGPYMGNVLRPSDRNTLEKIAFIQCVGSRDATCGNDYCSSVCCTYAVKESIIAKEHIGEVDTTIFFMDMRTYAKGFEEYYQRAKEEHGVRFVRSRVSSIAEVPETKNLRIKYETEYGKIMEEEFDLVVLSVGLEPSEGTMELAKKLDIELNDYGFCKTSEFSPLETSKPGIFVCGAFSGPKDIPETVAQASGAVAKADALLASARGTMTEIKEYPQEIDVTGQKPRIGVFVCHCGINIAGVIDVAEVAEYARTLDNVVYSETNLYTCSQDTQEKIKETIREQNLNRIVVAACTPRTHEPLFQETLKDAGLNRYLFEMANIRDQCSWVHQKEPEEALQKAKDLVRITVAKARLLQPLKEMTLELTKSGLVIGGGLAGMTASLALAEQGFSSFLIEREKELGGNLRRIHYTLNGEEVDTYLNEIIEKVKSNELIHVYTDTEIEDVKGFIGNFTTTISSNGNKEEIEHGITIVATGGKEHKPTEYLYGEDDRVITQQELEERIDHEDIDLGNYDNIVMIQCVGSRNDERKYCSRICCSEAIKNALKIKEKNPEANTYILYKDIRTYGFREDYYKKAREKGIVFVRYDDDTKPQVRLNDSSRSSESDTQLEVLVFDSILGEMLVLNPELLVLSAAVVPKENEQLAKALKVPLTNDGFFLEAHVKLRPVDFATDGIFLCGMAHSPKSIDETISQAQGSVARASVFLSKDYVNVVPTVSVVDEELCIGCGLCESICQFAAIQTEVTEEGKVAKVISASCKGCGTCGASCPQKAITMQHFTDEQLIAEVAAL